MFIRGHKPQESTGAGVGLDFEGGVAAVISLRKCSWAMPPKVIQFLSNSSGASAAMLELIRDVISLISFSFIAVTSGRPSVARASCGVQSSLLHMEISARAECLFGARCYMIPRNSHTHTPPAGD